MYALRASICMASVLLFVAHLEATVADLIAHWLLEKDARERSGPMHAVVHGGVVFAPVEGRPAAGFNGRDGVLEVADGPPLALGQSDFSISLWVHPRRPLTGVPGDLISKWDAPRRRGVNLYLSGGSSAYSSISDTRHVHFGIDDAYVDPGRDHGKPWASNSLISNLVVFQRQLYAGIADAAEPRDSARVFRLTGGQTWEDCGQIGGGDPTISTVMSMIVHDGRLYAGTGRWDWVIAKGNFPDNPPPRSTRVYVYEGGTTWRDLGEVGKGSRVLCLGSFNGTLFAGIDKVGGGHLYRLEGETWVDCGAPDGRNLENVMPFDGALYVATHGNFYRYESDGKFTPVGLAPHAIEQVHSLHVSGGRLVAGTWPQGYALRYMGGEKWDVLGRLGLPPGERKPINEINALVHHNGKLFAGAIPSSELHRYEEDGRWERLAQLGRRPDWAEGNVDSWVRLTALAGFQGRLFAGTGSCRGRAVDSEADETLGRVTSFGFGQMVSNEDDLPAGWAHLAAVRRGGVLELYVNGRLAARSLEQPDRELDISTSSRLRIGFGDLTYFSGALSDVRLYRGALSPQEIVALAHAEPVAGIKRDGDADYAAELPRIPPKSPAEALKTFRLHPGFRLEQAAAEPLLASPVAIDFDEDGRLYVAEFPEFNQASSQTPQGRGQIRLLEDTDDDGFYDKSTVFLDNVDSPTAVCCYDGGIFVGAVPDILYARDTDGDGKADIRRVVFTGFARDVLGEGMLNSFHCSFDNRIHVQTSLSGGTVRHSGNKDERPVSVRGQAFLFDPRTEAFEVASGGGQHGLSIDDWGRTFVNTNNQPVQLLMYDGRYLARNPYVEAPAAALTIAPGGYQTKVFRISDDEPWRVMRTRFRTRGLEGERPHPTEGDQPSGFYTACSGVTVYRGDAWPAEYRGNVFVGEVANNLVYRARVEPNGVGLTARRADPDAEFLASTDIWFRPVQFANGPDGALYVIDMYRHLIQGAAFLTPAILKHLDVSGGFDRGRLYRIVPERFQRRGRPRLSNASTAELVTLLEHANGWHRDTASRFLYQRQDRAAVAPLKRLLVESKSPVGRMHALYALDGLKSLDVETVMRGLRDPDSRVRGHALRLAEQFESAPEIRAQCARMTDDPDLRVRYQLAYSLGAVQGDTPSQSLARLAGRDGADSWCRLAFLSSVNSRAGDVFRLLIANNDFRTARHGRETLGALATLIGSANRPSEVASFVQGLDALPDSEDPLVRDLVRCLAAKLPTSGREQLSGAGGGKAGAVLAELLAEALK